MCSFRKTFPLLTRVAFIEQTLRSTASAVARQGSRRSDYADLKGYFAEADMVAHRTIATAIKQAFPSEMLLSEEGHENASAMPGALWIADPLCGTTNYVRSIPLYTHSLCFMERCRVVAAGIYHPALDEMFLAAPTQATLNGRPIRVSETQSLAESVVSFNCNQSAPGQDRVLAQLLSRLSPPATRRIHVLESANLEMAWVACGRLDAYANPADKIWDVAAGSLLIAAAGGESRPWAGRLGDLMRSRGVVAANRHLFEAVDNALKEVAFE